MMLLYFKSNFVCPITEDHKGLPDFLVTVFSFDCSVFQKQVSVQQRKRNERSCCSSCVVAEFY